MSRHLFSSESVTEGHPDKIADQLSDAVLDAVLDADPAGRVACEVLVTTGLVLVAGEITTDSHPDIPSLARATLRDIGYVDSSAGIDADTCAVLTALNRQSPDIARGVESGGAGDQGMMFGFAVDETPELMPLPITLAHRLTRRLAALRRDGTLPWARPDGKAQVTVEYEDGRPVRVDTVVVSAQHSADVSLERVRADVLEHVVGPVMPPDLFDPADCTFHINPTGRFVTGGPFADTGLTGRKIVVDTYGGAVPHGGGAFSGKDASKVDRSGAYGARWAAKNVVAAGLAARCVVQLAYAIGVAEPVAVHVDTAGTGRISDAGIARALRDVFDFRPRSLAESLHLLAPVFRPTAAYGHFGREPFARPRPDGRDLEFFAWERTDRIQDVRSALDL